MPSGRPGQASSGAHAEMRASLAEALEVPYSTNFVVEFDDFWAPTGNGYNWGHDWRLGT